MGDLKWPEAEAEAAAKAAVPLKICVYISAGSSRGGRGSLFWSAFLFSNVHSHVTSTLFKAFSVCGSPEYIFQIVFVFFLHSNNTFIFKTIVGERVT